MKKVTLGWVFALFSLGISSVCHAAASTGEKHSAKHHSQIKIVLVGDSTVALGGGWGPGFCSHFNSKVICIDDARNGQSSKSFRDMGAWAHALDERANYYIIQFGHNDEKPDARRHTDPDTTYSDELRQYIGNARKAGAEPVIVSPLARRTFRDSKPSNLDLYRYAVAAQKVAAEEHIPFLDLLSLSTSLLSKMSQAQADEFDAVGHPDFRTENKKRKLDRTHLNANGKAVFGLIVARRLVELCPELKSAFQEKAEQITVPPGYRTMLDTTYRHDVNLRLEQYPLRPT